TCCIASSVRQFSPAPPSCSPSTRVTQCGPAFSPRNPFRWRKERGGVNARMRKRNTWPEQFDDPFKPLIKQAGSPRPTATDDRSMEIFSDGLWLWERLSVWNAEAWAKWFDAAHHPAQGVLGSLVKAGCSHTELAKLLLALYVIPLGRPVSAK